MLFALLAVIGLGSMDTCEDGACISLLQLRDTADDDVLMGATETGESESSDEEDLANAIEEGLAQTSAADAESDVDLLVEEAATSEADAEVEDDDDDDDGDDDEDDEDDDALADPPALGLIQKVNKVFLHAASEDEDEKSTSAPDEDGDVHETGDEPDALADLDKFF